MWTITGPFDGEAQGDINTSKTKLLKSGKKYALGRKERPLVINNKKISHDHSEFIANPSFIPKLEVYNSKAKPIALTRGDTGDSKVIEPLSVQELEDGDRVCILAGIVLEVKWRRVSCFVPPARYPSISQEACISALTKPHALHTHHLTAKFETSVPVMTSLLSATQLVKPEWLNELIRLGDTPDESNPFSCSALEQAFHPPLENKYRPVFSPSLPTPLKLFKVWEPNEERINILRGYRFVLVAERDGEVDGDLRELVVRGGGEYEGFNIRSGHGKWRQLLAKGKRKVEELGSIGKELIIVAEDAKMQDALGSASWKNFVADAKSLGLHTVSQSALLQTAVHVDTSYLGGGNDAPSQDLSQLPDFIPNTHPDEPSLLGMAPKAAAKNQDRPASPPPDDPPERAPSQPSDEESPARPRRLLTRRAHLARQNILDDSTSMDVVPRGNSVEAKGESPSESPEDPAPARPMRLKRRAGTAAPRTVEQMLMMDDLETESAQEPPLKKFKALFDASDPDKGPDGGTQSVGAAYDIPIGGSSGNPPELQSVTQSDTLRTGSGATRRLDVVAEEEEEGTARDGVSLASKRRGATSADAIESAMDVDAPGGSTQAGARAKVQTTTRGKSVPRSTSVPASEPPVSKNATKSKKPPSTQHVVDTDDAFLTAVASTKRGKKTEDSFDREFNNLRISKPDLQREEQEEAWEVLGDFDDVRNIRGNFMVILDMDVFKGAENAHVGGGNRNPLWDHRPNFKKFKKKSESSARKPIEVVVNTENDYGMGSGYWKDNSQPSQTKAPVASQKAKAESRPTKGKRRAFTVAESDDEENVGDDSIFGGGRQTSRPPISTFEASADRLFLDSDDEDEKPARPDPPISEALDVEDSTLPPSGPSLTQTKRAPKKRPVIADDESDDGATFKGFGKKRRKIGR
ncbi:hypothetical protein BV22DRAFT_1048062 [Leucogyrophana mollusca]|uniref:Uncharacterized protein n=1 Tax=Leucogyrophana mollusca TaxID=85980 RepID=A0ACB8BDQ9_9AGAM|nr:hypothetical protein BV22DRAFT_1048062 [Leucogyrophana mollusca]